ncbi:MAG: phage tail sheath family protein [Conexibacter sp.]|nr:phage tail sheath family protein [Conexibacter sp.]
MRYTNPINTPGVYVNETPAPERPIQGVATSVTAFVGFAPTGPLNTPTEVTSWTDFERLFATESGPYLDGAYLAHSVRGFFANGGGLAWIIRIGHDDFEGRPFIQARSAADDTLVPYEFVKKATCATADRHADTEVRISLKRDGGTADLPTFEVSVAAGDAAETFSALTVTPGPRSVVAAINQGVGDDPASRLVTVVSCGGLLTTAELVPAELDGAVLATGAEPQALVLADLTGDERHMTGLAAVDLIPDVATVCLPDLMSPLLTAGPLDIRAVQGDVIAACEARRRMVILDPPPGLNASDVAEWRDGISPVNEYATLYWPWIEVMDPVANAPLQIPPSGHIAGAWSGVDSQRGVHKAPANVNLSGVLRPVADVSDAGQEPLNAAGINCLRSFPGRGTMVWGARTLESPPGDWRYINLRRLFNYLTASIMEGTAWAVFEPNDKVLWDQLTVSVSNFLTTAWRSKALSGASPHEAFFVRCDAHTNPPDLINLGEININIGVAPVKPAEFVVFTISLYQPGA